MKHPSRSLALSKELPIVSWPLKPIFLGILFLPRIVFGQSKGAEIDKYLAPLAERQQFSGVVLALDKDKVIFERAFGPANAELNVPNQLNTRFGIASVTKAMTLAIVMRFAEEGKLSLQDRLGKFIPDFPYADQITIEMLLQHRSGLIHEVLKPEEECLPHTAAEVVEKAKLIKPAYKPNEKTLYSNTGYIVLARILEIVAGRSYQQLLQEYIFARSGMKDSMDFNGEAIIKGRAQEYLLEANGMVHSPLKDYSSFVGAGSVFSTAQDIYLFAEAALNGKLGESVKSRYKGIFASNGNENGFRCYVRVDNNLGFGFVLISNLESGANDFIIRDLPEILQGKHVETPMLSKPAVVPDANRD